MKFLQQTFSSGEIRLLKICAAILGIIVLAWILFAPGMSAWEFNKVQKKLARLEQENKVLAEQNKALEEEINKLVNDPEYLEKVARKDYGLLKKNEVLYRFEK